MVQGGMMKMFYISIIFSICISQYMKTRLEYRADIVVEIISDLLVSNS